MLTLLHRAEMKNMKKSWFGFMGGSGGGGEAKKE